jgi:hypothetical protein
LGFPSRPPVRHRGPDRVPSYPRVTRDSSAGMGGRAVATRSASLVSGVGLPARYWLRRAAPDDCVAGSQHKRDLRNGRRVRARRAVLGHRTGLTHRSRIAGGVPGSLVGVRGLCHETTGLHPTTERACGAVSAMRWPPLVATGASSVSRPASAVLGPDHALSRAIDALETTLRQWRAVAAVLVGSVIALVEGRGWAPTVAGSAAIVLVGLTVIASAHGQRKRDVVLDMILNGQEPLAITAVQRQRDRLLCQRTRAKLASNVDEIIERATNRPKFQTRLVLPLFERPVVASVAGELRQIIELLLADDATARGVAGCERLITHACSPLYGQDAELLRQELHRLRDMLDGDQC